MNVGMQTLPWTLSMDRRLGEVHFEEVLAARERLSRELKATPLVTDPLLSRRLRARTQVKLENALPWASYKIRGAFNLVASLTDAQRRLGIVTASRGHHGRTLAHAARRHSVECTVFVPEGNDPGRSAAIAASGADVMVAGSDFDGAWQAAVRHATRTGALAVHPLREARLIAGYATVALEMIEQVGQPLDTVFVPLRGSDLASAVCLTFKVLSPHTRVIAVRTPSTPPFASVAPLLDDVFEVNEGEITGAVRCLAETLQHRVEGGEAAALAGALHAQRSIAGQRIGLVLTDGNLTATLLERALHGEIQGPAALGAQLAETLADMEYGPRASQP